MEKLNTSELLPVPFNLLVEPWPRHRKGGITRDNESMLRAFKGFTEMRWVDDRNLRFIRGGRFRDSLITVLSFFGVRYKIKISDVNVVYRPQLSNFVRIPTEVIQIIRLHDIFPVTNPAWFRLIPRLNFKRALDLSLSHPKTLFVCNSISTKSSLIEYCDGFTPNTVVLPCITNALTTSLCGNCSVCLDNESVGDKFYLLVGTIEPRKDYDFLLRTIESNFDSEAKFVVVGRKGWKCRTITSKLKSSKKVIWFDDCCDGSLSQLYRDSLAFISTSIDEGFNIPAFEARQLGKPIYLRDIDVHREFHEPYAKFFSSEEELLNILMAENKSIKHSTLDSSIHETYALEDAVLEIENYVRFNS